MELTRTVIVAVSAVCLLLSCDGNRGDGRESPGDKREWSILQDLELETREQRTAAVQFRAVDEYVAMAVPRDGDGRLVWLLLNPAHAPLYKQIPAANFWLEPDQFESITRDHPVTSTVTEALRSHLRLP